MNDTKGIPCMLLRFPIGDTKDRKRPCNYYQAQPLYFSRSVFKKAEFWTHDLWWESAKGWIRSEPKAQIIV